MKERIQLPDIEHCTGCQACRVACPVNAISMQENEKGHIYPVIDDTICIKCNKCAKTCPELSPVATHEEQTTAYAMWINDEENRKYSTSGGVSYLLSKKIIEQNGYFCGAVYENARAVHKITREKNEISKFQGSKYTHSDVNDVYKEIKKLLDDEKSVLFSSTPCQVAALRSYLRKDYDNLYTIDILCHGVPSRKTLRDRISYIQKEVQKGIKEIRFRDKQPDQHHTCVKYIFDDNTALSIPVVNDEYFRCFVTNHSLRENCFNCKYSNCRRVGDITLADFWLYSATKLKYHSYKKGVSLVLVNSDKGKALIESLRDKLTIDIRDITQAIRGNHNLKCPQLKPETFDQFWEEYLCGKTIEELCTKYYPKELPVPPDKITTRIKQFIKLTLSTLGIYKIR